MTKKELMKNIKSKQAVMGAIILSLMICISALSLATFVPEAVEAFDPQYETQYETQVGENWWNAGWGYRKLITVDSGEVMANLINFPILIYKSSDSDLQSLAQADGDDICFVLYSDNSTKLNHELERWNSTDGELIAWVNVPSLSSSTDTKIWMYYKNPTASNQQNVAGTWDSNYTAVYHMQNSTNISDSTSGNHYLINTGATYLGAGGMVGGAYDFEFTDNDKMTNAFVMDASALNNCTMESFIKPESYTGEGGIQIGTWVSGNTFWLICSDSGREQARTYPDNKASSSTANYLGLNSWHWTGMSLETLTGAFISCNGSTVPMDGDTSLSYDFTTVLDDTFNVGYLDMAVDSYFDGIIDEVRISNTNRSRAHQQTSFNTMNSKATFCAFSAQEQKPAQPDDFLHYKVITIDNAYVDGQLNGFPILIHDNTGDLLGEVLTNGSDIVFYNATNESQFSHEIEEYNSTSGELWAWVNVTSISPSAKTYVYMYYSDSDGAYTVGHNPKTVWDCNYTAVYHMNQSSGSTCYDSGIYNNHGTYQGNLPQPITGKIATAQSFNGIGANNISIPAGVAPSYAGTMETMTYFSSMSVTMLIVHLVESAAPSEYLKLAVTIDGAFNYQLVVAGSSTFDMITPVHYINTSIWYSLAGAYQSNDAVMYRNATQVGVDTSVTGTVLTYRNYRIGCNADTAGNAYNGTMDEVRISNTRRSNEWINATSHSNQQTSGFITLSVEHQSEEPSTFTIKGLEGSWNNITWTGTVGDTVWSNVTQPGGTLELNMSVNATNNITEMRVYCDDIDASILAGNITLYVSKENDTNWAVPTDNGGVFANGGSNITINATTWPAGAGSNPFTTPASGLTNTNTSIYMRFTLALGTVAGTYSQSDWKLYIGYYA